VKPTQPGSPEPAPVPGQQTGRRHRRRDGASLTVTRICTFAGVEAILDSWQELYVKGAAGNPFASPGWLVPWARHFTQERELRLLAVWRGGTLIGLAPWYLKETARPFRRLQLLGSGRHDSLTELPQVLTAPGEERSVLRAVVSEWSAAAAEWDWLELPIMDTQGWFEPEWLTGAVGERGLVQHKTTRANVVLDLPGDAAALHRGFKRNLLESMHRARNRLNRAGDPWSVSVHSDGMSVRAVLPTLARLHAARSTLRMHRNHADELAAVSRVSFLEDALTGMAGRGEAEIITLDVAGEPVAAQLVYLAPATTYLGLSGLNPAWWGVSPVTLLQLHAAERAVERGHTAFDLSVGPSVAKLRWSNQIKQHPEFIVCGPRRSSKAAYSAFRLAATAAGISREAVRHRPRERKEGKPHAHRAAD
jgi:CelD/BcsL family acetyltransferase involved in cellulose biosynthesis